MSLFDHFDKEVVILYKRNNEVINGIEALFDDEMFFIDDVQLPLEEGDILERTLPNKLIERYEIINRGFTKGQFSIPDSYQVVVKKLTGINESISSKATYKITANQVNIANDNATINANIHNGIDYENLKLIILNIKKNIPSNITNDDAEILNDSLDTIEQELSQPEPKRGLIKTVINGLKTLKGSVEFTSAIVTLYTFLSKIFGW